MKVLTSRSAQAAGRGPKRERNTAELAVGGVSVVRVFLRRLTVPALGLALAWSALAQSGVAQMKVAVIDMQGALLSTAEGKKAAEELKAKFGPRETEFNKR